MRYALLATVLALSGCTLYFDGPGGDDEPPTLPDSAPHPIPDAPAVGMARCESGKLYLVDYDDFGNQPGHGQGTQVGSCGNGCRTAAVLCDGQSCPTAQGALCTAPPSTGVHCSCITTASAPAGSWAPVKMRAALPGRSGSGGWPAGMRWLIGSTPPIPGKSAQRTA